MSLKVLGLHECNIGDAGVEAFSSAIKTRSGQLTACRELYLHGNRIGAGGMEALSEVISWGALECCRKLTVHANIVSGNPVLSALERRRKAIPAPFPATSTPRRTNSESLGRAATQHVNIRLQV
jgi:hypothetical protein